jgi:hypothetical protein
MDDFVRNLPTAIVEKGPKVLCHCGLLKNL